MSHYGYQQPTGSASAPPEEYSYQSVYNTNVRPGLTAKTSEDYGLSAAFLVDKRDSGMVLPPQNFTNSDAANLPNMRGDAQLRPNTGNSNQSAGDPLGSLQEITSRLRWMTIVSTCLAIIWEVFDFPLRLFGEIFTHPAQVVLGAYLAFFCLLLLSAELNNQELRDNFGVLYYPLSRGFFLLMLSSMCLGILNRWWESLLGVNFAIVGAGYIFAYIKYPEYRRWQHFNERMPTAWQEAKMYWSGEVVRTAAWASLQGSPSNESPQTAIPRETQALLAV